MKAVNLKTEYLRNPLGIDIVQPRFSWNCEGGVKQTSYQIITKVNDETVWDSGKVESSSMVHIPYGGKALKSRECVNWSVKLWDENGEEGEVSHSFFELGLLDVSDWKAKWITGNYKVKRKERYPVDCFRKGISVTKEVKSARLYITACGLYETKLDGQKIGNFVLAPGHTDYRKRVQYQTYDVTDMLAAGCHALTVQLADGWYRAALVLGASAISMARKPSSLLSWRSPMQMEAVIPSSQMKVGIGAMMARSVLPTTRTARWSMLTGYPATAVKQR